MASLREVAPAIRHAGAKNFFLGIWQKINEDQVLVLSSAQAYSWLFAIFPFLIFLLSLIPHLPQSARDKAFGDIHHFIEKSVPKEAEETIRINVREVMENRRPGLLSIGLVVTIFSASSGMNMTMYAMDKCYRIKKQRRFYQQRLMAAFLTIAVIILLLLTFLLLTVASYATGWMWNHHRMAAGWAWTVDLTRVPLAIFLMFTVLGTLYFFGPSVRPDVKFFSPGAIFTIAVWLLLEYTFRLFLNQFGEYDRTYGAVGGVAVLLLVFYVDAVVLLVGAEINAAIDQQFGRDLNAKSKHAGSDKTPLSSATNAPASVPEENNAL